ncbi:adenomatous polyposis coli homolog [Uloborus diversus]|uniref:adenomatous polyposis coli homolog n=1 Tax=Uloborus diversus TaxID=327109 RepID=UPI0024098449|nr:adenomatous polyposis coli homolog [Uloborus diversus]
MLNIDPLLFQPKVIRMSTTSSIGLPGQHIIRTTEYSNSQVMTGTTAQVHNEANNNILTSSNTLPFGDTLPRPREFQVPQSEREYRNFNNMDTTGILEQEEELSSVHHGEWSTDMYWSGDGECSDSSTLERIAHQNSESIISFQSNLSYSTASASFHSQLSEHSESKEELISSLLNKVRSQNKMEASKILLTMSSSVENCIAMRQCGCLPLLIELLHSPDENSNTYHMVHAKRVNFEIRERAGQVLHNIVFAQPDDKKGRREARVLRLLEQIRDYCDQLRSLDGDVDDNRNARCVDQHLGPSVAALMKLSFDEDHRYAMCQLGGLQAIAELLQMDQEVHGCTNDQYCITIRRYSGMALTNLTFGDGANKALLCSMRPFMEALVAQLYSPSEDLRQVTASVLRNLSWRADQASKRILRDIGAVTTLVKAAMEAEKESTLKSILSALWNLSAHCSGNKADICLVDGALAFLVSTLTYKSKSKTLAIVENGGGILRNVSSHIAIQNDYRIILRKHNCLQILLQHLKSPSLTVVSNACGTLWNLSARNAVDQRALWEMGAVGMLKKLINSKHKMISMGSSAALKNLLSAKPPGVNLGLCVHTDGYKTGIDVPSLHVRKQKALSTEIDQNLSETYDNTDSPKTSPVKHATQDKNNRSRRHISPSARYMTTQKQRNDLLSLQKRAAENETVVEEKHNGAFQVTKNTKQTLNFRQGQSRFQPDAKDNVHGLETAQYTTERNATDKHESGKLNSMHGKSDKQFLEQGDIPSVASKPGAFSKCVSDNTSQQVGVRKDYKTQERVTNIAQKAQTVNQDQDIAGRNSNDTSKPSAIPKPFHESKIPLPRSVSKHDSTRSQSASPVAQRRCQSQRRDSAHNVNSNTVDINVTHPKYAWNSSFEKVDNDPEQPANVGKTFVKEDQVYNRSAETMLFKSTNPKVLQSDDYNCTSEDEIKVYNTESTPVSYSYMSSMEDLDDVGATTRCSLNIKTNTNVKLMQNHPLLSNVHRTDDDNIKLFEVRNTYRQDDRFHDIGGGKTVDFSVQSDYDIDETLSMMSRSSSVASISSFDQQSFHDDESLASDLSHRTSGIESPSELSDSPCQTAPSSPRKGKTASLCNGMSDGSQMKSYAVEDEPEAFPVLAQNLGQEEEISASESHLDNSSDVDQRTMIRKQISIKSPDSTNVFFPDPKITGISCEKGAAHSKNGAIRETIEPSYVLTNHAVNNDFEEESAKNRCLPTTENTINNEIKLTEIKRISESTSSSSFVADLSAEDMSPEERVMLEQCIRAGLPQKSSEQHQGARQKVPQLSYQLLRDGLERHPNACSYEAERGTLLRNLEVKENEYESLSENEEKGKEDERKAEKNRLFRIPESPVDKKSSGQASEVEKTQYYHQKPDELHKQDACNLKVIIDQKGNRRSEKSKSKSASLTSNSSQKNTEKMPTQLDFLMSSNKKSIVTPENKASSQEKKTDSGNENAVISKLNREKCLETSSRNETTEDSRNSEKNISNGVIVTEDRIKEEVNVSDRNENAFDKIESKYKESSKNLIDKNSDETFEKDVDCSEKDNSGDYDDSIMLTSSILGEAREIAEALLGARVDSTEDMTVSTLSCLSDIDNARPPSVMGDLGSLSMTNSSTSEENLKIAVAKECQKLFGKSYNKQTSASKKSLLRELQIGRLNTDNASNENSKGYYDSTENLSLKSNSTSDLLGNINPPSILDDISLTASTGSLNSIECSDSEGEQDRRLVTPYKNNNDSMSERMHDAAAMAHLYAKELSNITGNCVKESPVTETAPQIKVPTVIQEVTEITIADVTEIGCDTIGSDTELEDDLPCDDEDFGSETLQAPMQNSLSKDEPGDGSTENLTLTLTEDPRHRDISPYYDFRAQSFMSAEDFRALQENADMIINTLKEAEISDEENGLSNGDMIEDETMSLVSNESDEEFLSPDGTVHHHQKCSPRTDHVLSPTYNGMVALPQSNVPSKYAFRKTSLPQISSKRKLISKNEQNTKNRNSYPDANTYVKVEQSNGDTCDYSRSPKKGSLIGRLNQNNENMITKLKAPTLNKKCNMQTNSVQQNTDHLNYTTLDDDGNSTFDSRTFTRKKSTVPKGMIPSVSSEMTQNSLKSPSSAYPPSLPQGRDNSVKTEPSKSIGSKIAAVWKNSGKSRSKSAVDANRNSKLRLEKTSSTGSNSSTSSREELGPDQRSSSQTSSPKSPLSRSSTFEKLNEEEKQAVPAVRRPNSLALSEKPNSPRHKALIAPQRNFISMQKLANDGSLKPRALPQDSKKCQLSEGAVLSPVSHQNNGNIPRMINKAQASLIPSRRSMIPTPAKFGGSEN